MPRGWGTDKFRNPIVSFAETLAAGANGTFRERDEYAQFLFKALVVAMDTQGGKLEMPDGRPADGQALVQRVQYPNGKVDEYTVADENGSVNVGPRNPKNSVKARIISNGIDEFTDDNDLRVYWPLFPGVDNPAAGEVVYVVFEDETMNHGLWLCRAPLNGELDTPNQVLIPPDIEGKEPASSRFVDGSAPQNTSKGSDGGYSAPKKDRFRLSRKFISVPK